MRKTKFEVGKIYHIFNGGVEKRDIFKENSDMWRFLQGMFLFNNENSSSNILYRVERENNGRINFLLLREFIKNHKEIKNPLVKIMADCLMPNHFHLILEEIKENGISRFMHKLSLGYACFFNKKYSRVGGLFRGRFKSVAVEDDIYLKHLLVYVNLINPAQLIELKLKENGVINIDKIMKLGENYQWSTNPEYLDNRESIIIEKGLLGEIFSNPEEYRSFSRDVLLSKKYNSIEKLTLED